MSIARSSQADSLWPLPSSAARVAIVLMMVAVAGAFAQSSSLFRSVVSYSSGENHYANNVRVVDVNGDKNADLVVLNQCGESAPYCGNSTIGILLGNGNGTFQPARTIPLTSSNAIALAVGDVTGDGHPDVVVGSPTSVALLIGDGTGGFELVNSLSFGMTRNCLALADMNADGKLDLILGSSLALGNGDGSFQPVQIMGSGLPVMSAVVADVNGDGIPDLINATDPCPDRDDCFYSGFVLVYLGPIDGTLKTPETYMSGYHPRGVAVADLNGDGKLDIAAVSAISDPWNPPSVGSVNILLGKGDGTFQAVPVGIYTAGSTASSIAAGDFNHDGKADLAVANFDSGNVAVFLGLGDGTFQKPVLFGSGGIQPSSVAVADLNNDRTADVVLANMYVSGAYAGSVGVLLNSYQSTTSTTLVSSLNPSIYGQKVAFTARVSTSGTLAPGGTVTFIWGSTYRTFNIGSATLDGNGRAVLLKSNLNAGVYNLTALYLGDPANARSTSSVVNQTVVQTSSAASITAFPNPARSGQTVTFTARVSSPTVTPSGPVTFTAGTAILGSSQLVAGKATFAASSLPLGSTVVKASFSGNSNIKGSSATITETVQP